MQNYTLAQDIKVICVQAKSFPEGIVEAHQSLHSLIPPDNNRRYFAISQRNQEGQIIYSAATEELNEGEAEKFGCETYIIQQGEYLSVLINEYKKDIPNIAKTFKELLSDPRLDPKGACVEMFLSETDILCMVKLKKLTSYTYTNLFRADLFQYLPTSSLIDCYRKINILIKTNT